MPTLSRNPQRLAVPLLMTLLRSDLLASLTATNTRLRLVYTSRHTVLAAACYAHSANLDDDALTT